MLPIYLSQEIKKKTVIDLCASPGGKAFQALSMGCKVKLNDISKKRINILKDNLKRLKFKNNVTNFDALNISNENKYDVVILDAPCSGIGTMRRNPEILFKKNPPNFNHLIKNQKLLINKAVEFLNKKGTLIYIVCSFIHKETKEIKEEFLNKHKNFSHKKFDSSKIINLHNFIDKDGDISCFPSEYMGYMTDGFYATKFIKND